MNEELFECKDSESFWRWFVLVMYISWRKTYMSSRFRKPFWFGKRILPIGKRPFFWKCVDTIRYEGHISGNDAVPACETGNSIWKDWITNAFGLQIECGCRNLVWFGHHFKREALFTKSYWCSSRVFGFLRFGMDNFPHVFIWRDDIRRDESRLYMVDGCHSRHYVLITIPSVETRFIASNKKTSRK